jgi:hypothetical protein
MFADDEEWQTISEYPNYQISTFGRVYNSRHDRMLKPFFKHEYAYVTLYRNGKAHDVRVHRLVALAFLPSRPSANQVNHLDGDKAYNGVQNLEWSTSSENIQHAFATGLKYQVNKRPVRIIQTGETFASLTDCARSINGSIGAISRCLSGSLKTHRGFTFETLEETEAFE